jgi:3-hydroxyisobutyrate dehydrogenase-like beta-hydroxyacid dehydrogenase
VVLTIVVVAPGEMGAGIGGRLVARGARVRTSLAGRGAASAERARKAGLEPIENDRALLEGADIVLSVVPPAAALPLAERFAPVLAGLAEKPVFADCNAIAPATMARIAGCLAASGAAVVDAAIIGAPPSGDGPGPRLYASGPAAERLLALRDVGLDVRLVDGGIGQASALKLSYAMLGKGVTALGTAMMLAADRAGVSADLCRELEASQPVLLAYLQRQVPGMLPKAYRWVAEMEEIAGFLGAPGAGSPIYDGAARVYERIARAVGAHGEEPAVLGAFLKRCGP